jgi:NADH-ubiquinone oxidoreductase chain 5
LPAAIAAPTPVSALVHSSTLVTAGVYLLIRFERLFCESKARQITLIVGGLTIFISGLNARFEFDLKKIIALSTLSQLGLIIIILSIKISKLAFFHLLTHAIFKALLFICAGSIIHNILNFQDIRFMGNIIKTLPLTTTIFNIANLTLCGIPFLAGFYSKDLILEYACISNLNILIFYIFYISTGLTVIYSLRLTYYLTTIRQKFLRNLIIYDNSNIIIKSKIILTLISIITGSILS